MAQLIQVFPQVLYAVFCVAAVLCAVAVVAAKNPVTSAFALILVLLNVAGVFALQEAHFVAAVQVLVYAGAIMVLFVFVIMLLSIEKVDHDFPARRMQWVLPGALGVSLVMMLFAIFSHGEARTGVGSATPQAIAEAGGNIRVISETMFSGYMLPFQVAGLILMICVAGAVVLAKRKVE